MNGKIGRRRRGKEVLRVRWVHVISTFTSSSEVVLVDAPDIAGGLLNFNGWRKRVRLNRVVLI